MTENTSPEETTAWNSELKFDILVPKENFQDIIKAYRLRLSEKPLPADYQPILTKFVKDLLDDAKRADRF
eukprot:g29907.t1